METYHPWMLKPAYRELAALPLPQRLEQLRKPEVKQRILNGQNQIEGVPVGSMEFGVAHIEPDFENVFPLMSQSTYEPPRDESFAAISAQTNQTPETVMYDYLVAEPGRMAILFFTNYSDFNLDAVREMQLDDATVTGLSDAGAHVSLIFDAVNPTYQLTYWTRDRKRGERLPLSHVIHRGTRRNAELFGFSDRGLIAPGMRADINVIDYDNLRLGELALCHDLPAGGARLMQGASGYLATMINGTITRRFDEDTGARPGRLIRS
jgi:N-acyl-D-aspartate/D-glutamate deacylase